VLLKLDQSDVHFLPTKKQKVFPQIFGFLNHPVYLQRSKGKYTHFYSHISYSYISMYCTQLWSLQHRTDMDLVEQVQRRPQKQSEGWNTSPVRKG